MRRSRVSPGRGVRRRLACGSGHALAACLLLCAFLRAASAQSTDVAQQVQQLKQAMAAAQARADESERQLEELRKQLEALEARVGQGSPEQGAPDLGSKIQGTPQDLAQAVDDLRERQEVQESESATLDQAKVGSESRYPVRLSGLLLWSSYVNMHAVDMAATPVIALPGAGSTGMTLRQTILGFDAQGPHLFGARSYAGLQVDFDGSSSSASTAGTYPGYGGTDISFLRLRTAHAGLQWQNTEAFFSLDRPIVSPETPASLTAVAEPALAWAGNLWAWNPQAGVKQTVSAGSGHALEFDGAFVDPADAPVSAAPAQGNTVAVASEADSSRCPGLEGSVTWRSSATNAATDPGQDERGNHVGAGWYFSPHLSPYGNRFNAWAGTTYGNLSLPLRLRLTGSFYRGSALGGLGGGGFKDYGYRPRSGGEGYAFRPLDDIGGWAQLKEKFDEHFELNTAFGLDNVFAYHLRYYAVPGGTTYQNLARNRAYTANFIYSPSAYLLFSLEYRRLLSAPVLGIGSSSDVLGAAVGYRF